jgi:hypothetical protein
MIMRLIMLLDRLLKWVFLLCILGGLLSMLLLDRPWIKDIELIAFSLIGTVVRAAIMWYIILRHTDRVVEYAQENVRKNIGAE